MKRITYLLLYLIPESAGLTVQECREQNKNCNKVLSNGICCQEVPWSKKTDDKKQLSCREFIDGPGDVYSALPLRLVGKNSSHEGLLQVYMQRLIPDYETDTYAIDRYGSSWTSICNPTVRDHTGRKKKLNAFSQGAANTACYQMGFDNATEVNYVDPRKWESLKNYQLEQARLTATSTSFNCANKTREFLINHIALETTTYNTHEISIFSDYDRPNSCETEELYVGKTLYPYGTMAPNSNSCRRDVSQVAIKCIDNTRKQYTLEQPANIWSHWGPWSDCLDNEYKKIQCKENNRGEGSWRSGIKVRERKCLTGLDCLSNWFEQVLCEKEDFERSNIPRCPCDYTNPHLDLTDLIKYFEAMNFGDFLVANPIDCGVNLTAKCECLKENEFGTMDCKNKDFRHGHFYGAGRYCPKFNKNGTLTDKSWFGKLVYFRNGHTKKREKLEGQGLEYSPTGDETLVKGSITCQGQSKKNKVRKKAFNHESIQRCLKQDSILYFKGGFTILYAKRIKLKWSEKSIDKRSVIDRHYGLTETDAEKRERKRRRRRENKTKLHRIGAHCKFSVLPLKFVVEKLKPELYMEKGDFKCIGEGGYDLLNPHATVDYYEEPGEETQTNYDFYGTYYEGDKQLNIDDYKKYYSSYKHTVQSSKKVYVNK